MDDKLIGDIYDILHDMHPFAEFCLEDRDGSLCLDYLSIESSMRNQGLGTEFMISLCSTAKENNLDVILYPMSERANVDIDPVFQRLKKFYSKFNFYEKETDTGRAMFFDSSCKKRQRMPTPF